LQRRDLPNRAADPWLKLVLRYRWAGIDADDGRLDIKAGQGLFDQLDVGLDLIVQPLFADGYGIEQALVGFHPNPLRLLLGDRPIDGDLLFSGRDDRQNGLNRRVLPPAKRRGLVNRRFWLEVEGGQQF